MLLCYCATVSLSKIGASAFENSGLTSITIPENVTSLGGQIFSGCSNLETVTFETSKIQVIPSNAFMNCKNGISISLKSNPFIASGAVFPSSYTLTMNLKANGDGNGNNWSTFYNHNYSFVADENTKVFKAELDGSKLMLHEVSDKIVNAQTAVILKSTGYPVMTNTSSTSSDSQNNSLSGVGISAYNLSITGNGSIYVLNKGSKGVGFYKLANGAKLGVGKAYLTYTGTSARDFFSFDEETTGIDGVKGQKEDVRGVYYDLQGRRVEHPTKGLYIVNGKKVIIK